MKTTFLKRILTIVMALLLTICAFACGKPSSESTKDSESVKESASESVGESSNKPSGPISVVTPAEVHLQNNLHKVTVTETNKPFVVNGESDYIVVIPEDASAELVKAVNYFVKYIEKATGCELPVREVSGLSYNSASKWIAVGCTDKFKNAGLQMPSDDIGNKGYYIKTTGSSVFVETKNNDGDAFWRAMLRLLDCLVGYEMYEANTVVFEKSGENMPVIEVIERPDFDYYMEHDNQEGDGRYGMGLNTDPIFISPEGKHVHNSFTLLKPSVYKTANPEWYSIDGHQLCYTARGNAEKYALMIKTIAEICIGYFEQYPTKNVMTITQEDVSRTCSCDACNANLAKYGGTAAASIIMFMNDVDDYIQNYFQEKAEASGKVKREVDILFFAYHKSELAPSVKNADGTYSPIDENVICNEHVGVYIAPIYADYTETFYNDKNEIYANNIIAWSACSKKLYLWLYETNFAYSLYPYNSYVSAIETYRFSYENNAIFILPQAQYYQGNVTHFSRLKAYINSKALFDVNSNYNEIVDDFFTNYFGPAAEPMRKFYDQMVALLNYNEVTYQEMNGNIYANMEQSQLWPKKTLDGWLDLCDEAYAKIEGLKTADPERYEIIAKYIKLETIFPRFALLRLYKGSFTTSEFTVAATSFKKDCEELNIRYLNEAGTLDFIFNQWGV